MTSAPRAKDGRRRNRPARLRLVADTYGLNRSEGHQLYRVLSDSIVNGGEFVRRRVVAGGPNFIQMWDDMGAMERFDRRRRWWAAHQDQFRR